MKLIIELKDETYKFFKEYTPILIARGNGKILSSEVYEAIKNGKPYDEAEVWRKSNELLEKRLAYLGNPKDRWISVKEKLPELHNSVVATDNNDVFVAWYDEGWKSSDSQFDKHTPIVAWRPIPQYTESEKQ